VNPPTIEELRDLQAELTYQAENQSEPLFIRARDVIEWFISDYLRSVPNDDDRGRLIAGMIE
jgi:hypothetical protein